MKVPRSNYAFSQVPSVVRPRSTFDKSRYYKSAFNAGKLIPFFLEEILPGDTCSLKVKAFARLATLIVPFMDNLYLDFFFFFVPNRLVWENWERFCGQQDNPEDSTDYLIPEVHIPKVETNSIYDYFGLPLYNGSVDNPMKVNALPFRAYNLIWNECFRDENLQNSVTVNTGDTADASTDYDLLYRGKRKSDPFNAALPFPQKGPGVEIGIGESAPIMSNGKAFTLYGGSTGNEFMLGSTNVGNLSSTGFPPNISMKVAGADIGDHATRTLSAGSTGSAQDYFLGFGSETGLMADLSHAGAVTINALREAFQIQKWYERLALGGSRYLEICLSMFGTHTGDARLQRPEYLGGGSTPIMVHSVVQSSATRDTTPQGWLAGYGISAIDGIGFTKSFVEHGHVIGLVSVRGDYGYQQGLDRMWSRRTKFDFYWPAFAHLGEVPVLNKEIFYQGTSADDEAFGYQERWYDYRYGVNKITGLLRSTATDSLEYWHLAQKFDNLPTLNSTFIQENPPVGRVLAVPEEPAFVFDSVVSCRMARVMPVYSTPGLVDHF